MVVFASGIVLLLAAVLLFFPSPAVNWLVKPMIERALASEYPGTVVRLGTLTYDAFGNRLACDTVRVRTLKGSVSMTTGELGVSGVRWLGMILKSDSRRSSLEGVQFDVRSIELRDPSAQYVFRCEVLRGSIPDSAVVARSVEMVPLHGDEPFFLADSFRTTRYRLMIDAIEMDGVDGADLVEGRAFRTRSVTIRDPLLDVKVNKDKPNKREPRASPFPNEFLLSLAAVVTVDSLRIVDGLFAYSERFKKDEKPAWITFDRVQAQIGGIDNAAATRGTIEIQAQWQLADVGPLNVSMSLPLEGPLDSFRFAGTLGAMDLKALNTFLEPSDQMRITHGMLQQASFLVRVDSGIARGHVRGVYRDLKVVVVDGQTGASGGLSRNVSSFIANTFLLRHNNAPDLSEGVKEGTVNYRRQHNDTFINFVWFSVRMGVREVIGS